MMDAGTLAIEGNEYGFESGAGIPDIARKAGICIPSLCTHPDLPVVEHAAGAAVVYRGVTEVPFRR